MIILLLELVWLKRTETPAIKSEDVLTVCSCHKNQGEWLVLTSPLKCKSMFAPLTLEANKKD